MRLLFGFYQAQPGLSRKKVSKEFTLFKSSFFFLLDPRLIFPGTFSSEVEDSKEIPNFSELNEKVACRNFRHTKISFDSYQEKPSLMV